MPGTPSPSAGLCESALHAIAGAGLWRANWLQHRRAPEQGRRAWRSRRAVIWVDFALEPCVKRAIGVELPLSKARGNCFRVPCGFLGSGLSRQPSLPPHCGQADSPPCRLLARVLSQVRRGLRKSGPPLLLPDFGILWEVVRPPQTAEGAGPQYGDPPLGAGTEAVVTRVRVESCKPGDQEARKDTHESLFVCGPCGAWVSESEVGNSSPERANQQDRRASPSRWSDHLKMALG